MSWHAGCYTKRVDDKYPVGKLSEEYGILDVIDNEGELGDDEEELQYTCARSGDHFMTPFQCDVCQFRNITLRDPIWGNPRDLRVFTAIRRAILDSFWSRATSTVDNNRRAVTKFEKIGTKLFTDQEVLPEMGPFPLADNWGMKTAVIMLERSMDKGKYSATLQFDTTRKFRSAYSNCWGASVQSYTNVVMARDTLKTYVSSCPTFSYWFERFMKGMHSRMGDDHRPDMAVTAEVMHALMNRVNVDYIEAHTEARRRFLARAGLFFLSAFLGGLRGEEVVRTVHYSIQLSPTW